MMRRLLGQDAYVARRSVILWLICIVAFLAEAAVRLDTDIELPIAPGLGLVYAFFAATYLGDFGSSGRLDGQIICGAPRPRVWIAAWATLAGSFVLILLSTAAGNLVSGLLRTGMVDSPLRWTLCLVGFVLNAVACAAVYTLIGMLLAGRRAGRGTIILIVLTCVFIIWSVWGGVLDNQLTEPEFIPVYDLPPGVEVAVYDMDSLYIVDTVPNPEYVSEPLRSTLQSWTRFLPVTQCDWLMTFLYDELTEQAYRILTEIYLYCVLLAAGSVLLGIALFARRELD